jgi:hypothetical protein
VLRVVFAVFFADEYIFARQFGFFFLQEARNLKNQSNLVQAFVKGKFLIGKYFSNEIGSKNNLLFKIKY